MRNRFISFFIISIILLSLCSCKEEKGEIGNSSTASNVSSSTDGTKSETTTSKPTTEADYLNVLYGYYETNEAYIFISADYYEEKSKIEEYDFRYGDIGNISVILADNGAVTYEISVDMQFLVYYSFDGKQINSLTGEYTKEITKEEYDKIPLKSFTYTPPASQPEAPTPEPDHTVPISQAKVGDSVYFGTYEQDNNLQNGKEKIEWLVIEKRDNYICVITKKLIESKTFHNDDVATTWEKCELRSWLNNTFINEAFTAEEQAKIPTVLVRTLGRKVKYTTDGGNDVEDKLFCLSIEDIEIFFPDKASRIAEKTPYLSINNRGSNSYWLRTPGDHGNETAMRIKSDGSIDKDGWYVEMSQTSVRPVMYVKVD